MTKIAFLGAGNIAQAIIGGLTSNGFNASDIWAADPSESQRQKLDQLGINTSENNEIAAQNADVIVISVKPNIVAELARSIGPIIQGKLVISVAAGITSTSLSTWLTNSAVIRCMPNTPALIQRGMTGLYATDSVSQEQRSLAETILSAIGDTRWFKQESDLDAVTAISGSGPAYFFYVIEVMQLAAEKLGLSAEESRQLVLQTAVGAAEMALQSTLPTAELRHNVTSPGGTTEAALKSLQRADLENIFLEAMTAAKDRSEALSKD
jgi:pyrroline-5-carboxylate reductase